MAKKTKKKAKTTKRKTTRKRTTSAKKSTRKAATGAASKKSARKKSAAKKKAATRKKTAKTAPAKKAARKAPAKKTTKKSARKAPAKKSTSKAPAKKTSKKSPARSSKTSRKKAAGKSRSEKAADRAPAQPTITLTDARAAASKLAALAGLPSLKNRTHEISTETEERERLTKTPLKKRELDKFREILLLKRREVAGDVTDMESEALGAGKNELSSLPQHMADHGSDEYEQSLSLNLAHSQRSLLKEIDAALERIENKTFGVCEAIGVPISMERLDATPWARYSLDGARKMDRGEVSS